MATAETTDQDAEVAQHGRRGLRHGVVVICCRRRARIGISQFPKSVKYKLGADIPRRSRTPAGRSL